MGTAGPTGAEIIAAAGDPAGKGVIVAAAVAAGAEVEAATSGPTAVDIAAVRGTAGRSVTGAGRPAAEEFTAAPAAPF